MGVILWPALLVYPHGPMLQGIVFTWYPVRGIRNKLTLLWIWRYYTPPCRTHHTNSTYTGRPRYNDIRLSMRCEPVGWMFLPSMERDHLTNYDSWLIVIQLHHKSKVVDDFLCYTCPGLLVSLRYVGIGVGRDHVRIAHYFDLVKLHNVSLLY